MNKLTEALCSRDRKDADHQKWEIIRFKGLLILEPYVIREFQFISSSLYKGLLSYSSVAAKNFRNECVVSHNASCSERI